MVLTTRTRSYTLLLESISAQMAPASEAGSLEDDPSAIVDIEKGNFLWTRKKLFAVLFSAMASSLAWAVQVGYSTPTLLHLGMRPDTVGLAWLAGPFSGIIVQPLIGVLSDCSRSRFGRRRPFILGAALSTALSLILFSQTERIGWVLFGQNDLQRRFSLCLAIITFCLMDCSINAMMAPTRAMIADIVPTSQQNEATAYVSIHDGLGKATGYLIGSVNLEKFLPRLGGELQVVFLGAAILIVLFCCVTVVLASDDRQFVGEDRSQISRMSIVKAVCASFVVMPRLPKGVRRAFLIQFCNSFAWFSFMVYGTDYFGQHINKGLPSAVLGSVDRMNYDEGVRIGNFALFFLSITSAGFAHCLAALIRRFSLVSVFATAELHLMLTLLAMPFISTNRSAILLYSVLGLTFAATNTIPWMIVTKEISRTPEAGVFSATFNLSQCLPQIIASLLSGPILVEFKGNIASIFVMGAIGAGLASGMILFLIEENSNDYEQLNEIHVGETPVAVAH